MAFLWSLVVVDPLIILSTIVCGLLSILVTLFDKTGDTGIVVARLWARSLLLFAGVKVKVEGLEKLPGRSCVICSNHLSYMDTPVVLSSIPERFRFLAKRGLFEIPFLGTHLTQAGHIPVPREDPRAAVKTMTQAAEIIRTRGISMLVFPEGGRSFDGVLQPFKEGAAYIAIKAGVPIVPIALIGTREVLPMGGKVFRRGTVIVRVSDPVPTEGLTLKGREQVITAVRERIVGMLER
ncbi:MAG: lysophospholipid acyltransferase family protein [Bryobacteraceae bacterium]